MAAGKAPACKSQAPSSCRPFPVVHPVGFPPLDTPIQILRQVEGREGGRPRRPQSPQAPPPSCVNRPAAMRRRSFNTRAQLTETAGMRERGERKRKMAERLLQVCPALSPSLRPFPEPSPPWLPLLSALAAQRLLITTTNFDPLPERSTADER